MYRWAFILQFYITGMKFRNTGEYYSTVLQFIYKLCFSTHIFLIISREIKFLSGVLVRLTFL